MRYDEARMVGQDGKVARTSSSRRRLVEDREIALLVQQTEAEDLTVDMACGIYDIIVLPEPDLTSAGAMISS